MHGAVFLPCWLVGLRFPSTGAYRLLGGAWSWCQNVGSRRPHANVYSLIPLPAVSLSPQWATAILHLLRRPLKAIRYVWSKLLWSHCFCPGSQCAWDLVFFLQEWILCFLQSCGAPALQLHWPSKPNALGVSPSNPEPQAGVPAMGLRTLNPVWELLWYNCSPVCASPTQGVWDLIISQLCPSYHLISILFKCPYIHLGLELMCEIGFFS